MKKTVVEHTQTWFEKLAYKTNPFTIKPSHQRTLYGLSEPFKDMIKQVKKGPITFIHGRYGAGKTSFLKHLIAHIKGTHQVIYVACNHLHEPLNIPDLLIGKYGALSRLLKIKAKKAIILLDEIEHLSTQDFSHVKKHLKDVNSIVFVTHDETVIPSTIKIEKTFSFGTLQEEEVIDLVRERIGDNPLMTDEVIIELYKKDDRMRQFLKNCETYMRHMVENNRKSAKPKDVHKILDTHQV